MWQVCLGLYADIGFGGGTPYTGGSLPEHAMKNRLFHHFLWLVLAIAGTAVGLAGCGQKGDLYLPEKPPQQQPND
jgi:predicted small lipoprotein YifL